MIDTQYSINARVHSPEEASGLAVLAFQDLFRRQNRKFYTWEKEVVAKLGRQTFVKLVEDEVKALTESLHGDDSTSPLSPDIGVIYLTPDIVEVSASYAISRSLVDTNNAVRVYVNLNNNNDGEDLYGNEVQYEGGNNVSVAKLEVMGDEVLCAKFITGFLKKLEEAQRAEKLSLVKWIYSAGNYNKSKVFQVKKEWEISEKFYPWIKDHLNELSVEQNSLKAYYEAYLKSNSQILVMFGDPGTGKTSFLRDMICEMNLNAFISYDLKVLTSDATFVDYLTSDIFDVIVIEDADDLLTSTRGEHNKVISKILNVSDGLIKLPKKKLIFTTNLKDVNEIDSAVYRLGRCFDVLNFRSLTVEEAKEAAEFVGVDLESKRHKRGTDIESYTLADIFFLKSIGDNEDPFVKKNQDRLKRGFGFVK